MGTPGRILDHLRNSPSVSLDELDVLVLDEVDRLLELGFQEELEELLRYCPATRQTLLFSATMTARVDDLAKLSLRKVRSFMTQYSKRYPDLHLRTHAFNSLFASKPLEGQRQ